MYEKVKKFPKNRKSIEIYNKIIYIITNFIQNILISKKLIQFFQKEFQNVIYNKNNCLTWIRRLFN